MREISADQSRVLWTAIDQCPHVESDVNEQQRGVGVSGEEEALF